MMRSIHTNFAVAAFTVAIVLAGAGTAGATVYDAKADWSSTSNANGVWSERAGAVVLPLVTNWQGFGANAWAPSNTSGNFLPAFFQANAVGSSLSGCATCDWQPGDLVVHTTDGANGSANGIANLLFTAPTGGVADISGLFWAARILGRQQDWAILLNGVQLGGASGTLPGDGTNGRAAPDTYSISGVVLHAGDQLELQMFQDTGAPFGDFVGYNLNVNLTAGILPGVPEPASWALMICGFGITGAALRRRRTAVAC